MKIIFYIISFYVYAHSYNNIEQNIICGNYEYAYDLSISTIKSYPKADWSIVYNSWILADTLHDYTDLELLSYELARRGVSLNFLKTFNFYKKYENEIYNSWMQGNNEFKETYKEDFLDSLLYMFDRDQDIRQTYVDRKEVDEVDSLNMVLFEKLVKEYGFPNEFLIGLNSYNNFKPSRYHFRTMYKHFSLSNYISFKEILDTEFLKGNIDLYEYTRYISNYTNPKPPLIIRRPFHLFESKYCVEKFPDENLKKINKLRKLYGFPSYKEQLNCNVYFVKNEGNNKFYVHHNIDIIPHFPKETMLKIKKLLNEVDIQSYEISCPDK